MLASSSPQVLGGLQVAEPGKKINIGNGVESTIRRVLKDDGLESVALEVEINNRSQNEKESLAKTQKPSPKKLFGWL